MRCKNCDYSLWNLKSRTCPECGTGFKPTEYEFAQSRVQFRCPHCAQQYFGTGPNGHLVPRTFECVQCKAYIDMDQMVLVPDGDDWTDAIVTGKQPWLERQRIGRFKAWFSTLGSSMAQPRNLMERTPLTAPTGSSWLFLLITAFVPSVIGMMPFFLLGRMATAPVSLATVGFGLALFLFLPATMALGALAWALLAHLLIRISGPHEGRLLNTMQSVNYTSGPLVISGVPCVGFYLLVPAWIWWMVCASIALKTTHRIHGVRATIAGVVPPLIVLVGTFGAVFALIGFSSGRMPSQLVSGGLATSSAQLMASSINTFENRKGRLPDHGVELLSARLTTQSMFVLPGSGTNQLNITVNGTPLEWYITATKSEQQREVAMAVDALGPEPVMHRIGDYLFVMHGLPATPASGSGLWTLIACDDKRTNNSGASFVIVGMRDGTTQLFSPEEFVPALEVQNQMRKSAGAPELPVDQVLIDLGL